MGVDIFQEDLLLFWKLVADYFILFYKGQRNPPNSYIDFRAQCFLKLVLNLGRWIDALNAYYPKQ
jgi:hypothetical protein